jgi:hypothetical protein
LFQVLQVRPEQFAHRPVVARQKHDEGPPDVIRDPLVLKEPVDIEKIARMLPVECRAQLPSIQIRQ